MPSLPQYREVRFRQPSRFERELGLWVDRIGEGRQTAERPPTRVRQLGHYAGVAVQSGAGRLYLASGRVLPVRAGDVILHRPEQAIAYGPVQHWSTRWIVWNGPEAATLEYLNIFPSSDDIVAGAAEAVRSAHQTLVSLMPHEDATAALRRKQVLLDLILRFGEAGSESAGRGKGGGDFSAQVAAWLEAQGARPIAIPELARHFHMSPTHFRRVFRARTGRGPVEFINAWRIRRAQELLSAGVAIKDAAARTGFRDLFYFMRVFKRVTGLTAGQFARRPAHLP